MCSALPLAEGGVVLMCFPLSVLFFLLVLVIVRPAVVRGVLRSFIFGCVCVWSITLCVCCPRLSEWICVSTPLFWVVAAEERRSDAEGLRFIMYEWCLHVPNAAAVRRCVAVMFRLLSIAILRASA
jgi:hypothetical protein